MSFFIQGRTCCALTGATLERRHAAQLISRAPGLLVDFAVPGSEWVDRASWARWPDAELWIDSSTDLLLHAYANGPHESKLCARGLVRVTGPHGGALIDLVHLWPLTLDEAQSGLLTAALETALGGGRSTVDLGAQQLTIDAAGQLSLRDRDGELIAADTLPAARLGAWRSALGVERARGPVPSFTGEGGNHRLVLTPPYPDGARGLVGALRADLAAAELTTGRSLRVLGGHEGQLGTEVWLQGDLMPWRAMATIRVAPVAFTGLVGSVVVESRAVASLSELRRDNGPWPITWRGGAAVSHLCPRGGVSLSQMEILIEHLEAAFGVGSAWLAAEGVRLASPADPERVLEMVVLWAQRTWVEPQIIEVS